MKGVPEKCRLCTAGIVRDGGNRKYYTAINWLGLEWGSFETDHLRKVIKVGKAQEPSHRSLIH